MAAQRKHCFSCLPHLTLNSDFFVGGLLLTPVGLGLALHMRQAFQVANWETHTWPVPGYNCGGSASGMVQSAARISRKPATSTLSTQFAVSPSKLNRAQTSGQSCRGHSTAGTNLEEWPGMDIAKHRYCLALARVSSLSLGSVARREKMRRRRNSARPRPRR